MGNLKNFSALCFPFFFPFFTTKSKMKRPYTSLTAPALWPLGWRSVGDADLSWAKHHFKDNLKKTDWTCC